ELALWGAGEGLALLDPPPAGALAQARALLRSLDALDPEGRVTPHGRAMAALGLHPRLAHMLIRAKEEGEGALACAIAALLEARDPLRGQRDADLGHRLELLLGLARDARADRGAVEEARSLMRQWQRQLGVGGTVEGPSGAGKLLALAYPDRVAQRAGGAGEYRLANGRRAILSPEEPLAGAEFLVVASLDGAAERARIFLALPIGRAEVEALFADRIEENDVIAWDSQAEAVTARRERRLAALLLDAKAISGGDTAPAVAEAIRRLGHEALPWNAAARQLQARIAFLRALAPDAWPDLSDEALLADPLAWLGLQLRGVTRRAQFQRLDLAKALRERLDWRQRAELDRLAPEQLLVPSGRAVPLDYSGGQPVLAVKLQELFGLTATPRVADGRVPVTIQLLSPAGRPVQTTQDLAGFWRTGYAAVRAELRGRYPKHPWPDDPLTAPPQRGTKKSSR
ncbi:MAG TPA: ATP-dependent helicase C-terminal domain-containing protein, partial [Kiloniellales bacterium]|nr:ATP-dependent helicase C-terminal domain-containing protein [Kiloniellales bacterium]